MACTPEASQAVETTPLPHPQRLERTAPQHCLRVPQSLVSLGQGHPLSLRILPLQAPVVPGETCLDLESGVLSLLELTLLNLPCLTTPGQQDPSLQKTPGRLRLRWTIRPRTSRSLIRPGKSTDNRISRGTLGLQAECTHALVYLLISLEFFPI